MNPSSSPSPDPTVADRYQRLAIDVLAALVEPIEFRAAIERVLSSIQRATKCDAVGIRLQANEDFPYFLQNGFSSDFLLTENSLLVRDPNGGICRNPDGTVSLECTCGLVISGKTDPSNPLFTPGGSAWTNDSFPFLEVPESEDPRLHPRNQCIHQGYASVALIPIRARETIVGLLQLNGFAKGLFSPESIQTLEQIAAHVGNALLCKQAKDDLRRNEAFWHGLFENISPGVAVYDPLPDGSNFIFKDLNPAGLRISALRIEDVVGRPVTAVFPGVRKMGLFDVFQRVRRTGQPESFSTAFYSDSRLAHWYENYVFKLTTGEIVAIYDDVTPRKHAEESLREAVAREQAANAAKSQFLANMSHEIRTPMNGVLGMAALLAGTELNEGQRKYVDILVQSGERLLGVVNDILDISRIEAGQIALVNKPVHLGQLALDTLSPLAALARQKGLQFNVYVAPDIPDALMGDGNRIGQILANLVGNAIKFTHAGNVTVRCKMLLKDPRRAIVQWTVSDTGIGIPPDKLDQLFKPFPKWTPPTPANTAAPASVWPSPANWPNAWAANWNSPACPAKAPPPPLPSPCPSPPQTPPRRRPIPSPSTPASAATCCWPKTIPSASFWPTRFSRNWASPQTPSAMARKPSTPSSPANPSTSSSWTAKCRRWMDIKQPRPFAPEKPAKHAGPFPSSPKPPTP